MNNVCLTGRLTRDPELKIFDTGKLASFTLAVDNKNTDSVFINVTVYNDYAETIAKLLRKGRLISVVGSLGQRTIEKQNGEKQVITFVKLESFDFLDKKPSEETQPKKKPNTPEDIYNDIPTDDDLPF